MTNCQIRIRKVQSATDLNSFIAFPYALYKNEAAWVPPLRITQRSLFSPDHLFWKKNPHQFYLAFKNGRCIGRIAAFINKEHNAFHNCNEGCFGFLEAEEDPTVFRRLLWEAETFVKQNHGEQIIGPLNPSLHYELGVLVDGFEHPPYIMQTHNFSYYDQLINLSGFTKARDFYSYKLTSDQCAPTEKMERVNSFLQKRNNIVIRTADINSFDKELDIFFRIYNDAFIGHWGFTPMGEDEFRLMARDMRSIIDPEMVLIAEIDQEPAAFLLCLPNFNEVLIRIKNGRLLPTGIFKIMTGRKKIRSVRLMLVAVKKSFEHLGMGAILYPEIMKRAQQFNYLEGELSWVVEDNYKMNRIAKDLGATLYKTYRLYSKKLKDS